MQVAINITREPLAGITSTNLSLLDYLHESNTCFTGIELNNFRLFRSPIVYRHLSPLWFNHNILSICDYNLNKIIKSSKNLKDVEKKFEPIIDIIRKILRKESPDIFLINGTYYIPWLLSIAAKKEKVPIVLWYAGILSKEVEHMTPKFRRIMHEMEKSIIKRAEKIIFPSSLCQKVVYNEILCSKNVKNGLVVPNPISTIFTRAESISMGVERRIAFVGRYTPVKNADEFIKIHKRLLKEGWKHEATIVSDIPKKYLKKIPKTIKVVPSMSATELKTFYATQGLIISPSHFETFGNVSIEAVCTGIPVLVSDNMGNSEVLISSGLERMVADFSNCDLVVQRIKELCGQSILPRQLNNVRRRVDPRYVAGKIHTVLKSQE